ncbi:nucleoside transporter C-terminal domain-containing protein [Shigella flexneri]
MVGLTRSDANLAGSLIGQKLAINEFVAYRNFTPYLQTVALWMLKPWRLFLFALCGIANFGSIGVVVGGASLPVRHTVRRKSPNLVYARWRRRHSSNLMSATIGGFFIGLA